MTKKNNLKRMITYYSKYKTVFWLDLLFAALSAAVVLVIPLVVRYVTSTLVYLPREEVLSQGLVIAIVLIALIVLDLWCKYYISNIGHVMGAKIEYDMRSEIFEHLQKMSFNFYNNQKVGSLMSRITTDLFDITELMHHGPENIILCTIKISGALVILCTINIKLALAAIIVLPFLMVFAYVMNKRMRSAFRNNRVKIAEINGQIEDNLSGIRVVKSFANEQIENEKFMVGNKGFLSAKKNSYFNMGIFQAGVGNFSTIVQVFVIITGIVLIANGDVNVTDFITFMLYISVLTEPINVLVNFTEQFQNGYTGFERFVEIMDTKPDIVDSKDAIELPSVRGDISFSDVSFKYEDGNSQVLSHVNLDIPAGAYYALVGSSGAGKTTLCSLIPRFFDTNEGSVSIDGHDVRTVTLASLRNQIGIVQQDVYLFAGTIYENILYGRPAASREEVIEAAKNANAHEFIMSLPNGYDTDIGQRGVKLSGGQKQRISIARVFLKNPPVLIFDEATSALDNESEKVVQESLETLAKNRTTIVIAHRLSTIRNAEKIIVLTEEGVAEQGSHQELMAKGGIYQNLYDMQFKN
ncbi:MAG: ABC transporter ATP-binding protein [Pseudobutyrivibrio sp.]|nr:ABC transporter ATP-binding protein [Pseudobutyrivibrio sp.]